VANQSQENREVFLTPEYVWYSVLAAFILA